jgi:predicted Zn-dependent protease
VDEVFVHSCSRFANLLLICVCALLVSAQQKPDDPVLQTMRQELDRSFQNLKKSSVPPYFLSYQLTDNRSVQISASFGALISSEEDASRLLDIDLRVGDFSLDNTHPIREGGAFGGDQSRAGAERMPLDDAPDALRVALWRETESHYRRAVQRYAAVKANVQVKVEQEDRSADFSHEAPETYYEAPARFAFDRGAWEKKLRELTAPFAGHPEIIESTASIDAEIETRRYVNSDGGLIQISSPFYRLVITASAKAEDGMELPLNQTYMSFRPEGLPGDETVKKDVDQMIANLLALVKAPVADPYTGPAVLSGRASAVFFHEIFGHRVEGQRQKNEEEGQTFKKKVNEAVLPDFLSVYSDPTLRQAAGTDLMGYYAYDDEGVKARRVTVVDKGILRNFLMSRSPIEGFDHSNGHGRRQQGYAVTARPSNLIVESARQVSRAELKKLLLEQVKAAHQPYGLFFDDIEGGFTFTQRTMPNAFNVLPTLVYRVYPDGREELVRGVDLIGTPLIAFSKIVAADDQVAVFNGMCGAESGWVPVSAASPGVLVSQIEVQRKEKSQERVPILPPPPAASTPPSDVPMRALKDELDRNVSRLRLENMDKPYFVAYRLDDIDAVSVSATLGSLTASQPMRLRMASVEVRAGDYDLDNSNFFSERGLGALSRGTSSAPLDNNYQQLRHVLWLDTDRQYKAALEDLAAKRAALQNRKRADDLPDFSHESPGAYSEPPSSTRSDPAALEALARAVSGVFKDYPQILSATVQVGYGDVYTRYVNSEGSAFTRSQTMLRLQLNAEAQAASGLPISDSLTVYGRSLADFPGREVLLERARGLASRLLQTREAAEVEHYNGPVLFEGDSAAELFSQQFAPGLVAARTPVSDNPQYEMVFNRVMSQFGGGSMGDKIGARVLPDFLSVTDDPLRQDYQGARLLGSLAVDDDAVKTRSTPLVAHGVLKTLLAARTPVRAVPHSTGSRRGRGPAPSNLIVTSDRPQSAQELRQALLAQVKERGLDYGIVVRRLGNGGGQRSLARMAARMAAQPESDSSDALAEVYKLYPDGRQEPVKGLELTDLNRSAFKDIVAAGDTPAVLTDEFLGRGGLFSMATSYSAPIATFVVPALLFDDVSMVNSQGPFPPLPVSPSPLDKAAAKP